MKALHITANDEATQIRIHDFPNNTHWESSDRLQHLFGSDFGKIKERGSITNSNLLVIEVRDSWTEYLVPAHDGSGLLPDWESCWDAVAAAAAVTAVTRKFRFAFWPGNYIWSFQIGFWLIWELSEFWDRGSTQTFEPDWSSRAIWPGEPFWKICLFSCYF